VSKKIKIGQCFTELFNESYRHGFYSESDVITNKVIYLQL